VNTAVAVVVRVLWWRVLHLLFRVALCLYQWVQAVLRAMA
jgi:hypothetical protein